MKLIGNTPTKEFVIAKEMKRMEMIYGGEMGATKMCPLYFYNRFFMVDGKKVEKLTQQEWAIQTDSSIRFLRRRGGRL